MASLSAYRPQFFADDGSFLNAGKVYFYVAGTTTAQDTYTDQGGGTPNANPVILNSRGEASIWLDESLSYKVVVKTSADVTIWTEDNVRINAAKSVRTVANKAAAVLITPTTDYNVFVNGTDGGLFYAVTGAAPGTYADNGGSYCGTMYIPTGGDGSSAWIRDGWSVYAQSSPCYVAWFGVTAGEADSTSKAQVAINVFAGREIIFPASSSAYILDGITVPTDTWIRGEGYGTLFQHKASSANNLISLTSGAVLRARISDLRIDGNKSNQTSSVYGIYIDNTSGGSGTIARHIIENLHITNCKGSGIYMGLYTRESKLDNINCYANDINGFTLANADSIITNCISGQSGDDGFRITGNALQISDCKSWYSGRLTAGSAGFLFRNSSFITGRNLYAQENSGPGFSLYGQSGALVGHDLDGTSDGDNKAASTHAGWNLNNVDGAKINARTTKFPTAAGTPYYGMAISSNTTNCDIVLKSENTTSYPISGVNANPNTIRINNHNTINADVGDSAATLTGGTSKSTQIWNTPITADRAVTLTASPAWGDLKFKIVRTAAATGAFNLNVGTGPLKALAAGTWCEVTFNGTAWVLTAYGAL